MGLELVFDLSDYQFRSMFIFKKSPLSLCKNTITVVIVEKECCSLVLMTRSILLDQCLIGEIFHPCFDGI